MKSRIRQLPYRSTLIAWALVLVLATLVAALPGCGSSDPETTDLADPGKLLDTYDRSRRRHDPLRFVEVDLGEFFTTKYVGEKGTYTIRFRLYAVIDQKQKLELKEAIAKREKRMRDKVFTTLGKTELEYFREPTLGWIRSELIVAVNRALHTRVIRDVVFSEFAFEKA